MSYFYAPSSGGFYTREIHGEAIPADAVEITTEEHAALMEAQAAGLLIVPGQDGAPIAVPPPGPTLDQRRAARKREAAAERDAQLAAGMPWLGKILQIDAVSQANISYALQRAERGDLEPDFAWRMQDNTALPLDAAGMIDMAEAAGRRVTAIRRHYWALVDAIAAASDEAVLAAIDLSAGWPEAT